MANVFENILSDPKTQSWPTKASTAMSIGDLCYYVSAQVKPISLLTPGASEAADQATISPIFAGVAMDARLSTETDDNALRLFAVEGIFDFLCPSQTFNIGDLVGPTRDGGSALVAQKVTLAADAAHAIGKVVQQYTSATTKVRVRLWSHIASNPVA